MRSLNDPITGADISEALDHYYIHKGIGYVLCGDTGSIAAAGVEHISFRTPPKSVGIVHLRPARVSSSANSLSMAIVEGAIMTSGAAATPRNCNRNKKDASGVTIATGATLSLAGGAQIYKISVGSGGVTDRSGGGSGESEERVLKPETTYSITFTNTGAVTATVGTYTLFWYEEEKGE